MTRARDRLYLYAPLRLHHHRNASDDRHSLGQLTRFLDGQALAQCEVTQAARPSLTPLAPLAPLAASVDRDLRSLWAASS